MRTKIDHFALGSQVLAHRRAWDSFRSRAIELMPPDQMTTPDFGYDFHG